jgi:hypothetical protein
MMSAEPILAHAAWLTSGYQEELESAIASLRGFDSSEVTRHRDSWRRRISEGRHKIIEILSAGADNNAD